LDLRALIRENDSDKYVVFVDLWRRGFFIADGCRYGVDFAVYEADPNECHAFASILVKDADWKLSMPQVNRNEVVQYKLENIQKILL